MIAAVVVTFSAPAPVLDRCLRALRDAGGLDRILVVDTGGAAVVEPDLATAVELVGMENRGYGAAANLGCDRVSEARTIVVLNDDVVVQPGWLEPLVAEFGAADTTTDTTTTTSTTSTTTNTTTTGRRVGAVQPVLVGHDHSVVTSLGVRLDRYGAGSDVGDGEPLPTDRSARDLEIFNGGTVAFSREFLDDTGGFDERFFLYYEDVDLALRGRRLGWSYRLAPMSVVEHRRGTSTDADAAGTRFHQERNRLRTAFRFAAPVTVARAVGLSVRRLRYEPRALHARALIAGLAAAPIAVLERLRGLDRRTARR